MKYTLIAVVAFLIVVYAYTYIKHRKRRNNQTSTVKEFKSKYLKKAEKETENISQGYTPYLSKYNSSLDYVDKSEFLKSASDSQPPASKSQSRKY